MITISYIHFEEVSSMAACETQIAFAGPVVPDEKQMAATCLDPSPISVGL